ncbi:uncharacterized protein N7503_005352 [Penicillium pulvis]|uniref:uncharacterized protein n=1 Tax=Penicillium pulvis TaxID=1562058 RepID=UPI0025498AF0|nr:uncharacterized protein N7503_005352 [Penicillium pulvis]KAJ5802902.1 hypothetical protein N7503_005352 [Penicillium pulvis]
MENPAFSGVIAPSKTLLAFAIAIVKHKPPDKDVKDYILEIRHFIRHGLPVESSDKFFDSVAFWQKAYGESEAEQAKLLNKVFELEQRTQGLLSKINEAQSASNTFSPSNKRKASSSGRLKGLDPPRKKAQSRNSQAQRVKATDNEDDEDSRNENVDPKLMRQLYTVERALQKRYNSKPLTTDAVTLCKIAESEILGAIIRLNTPESQSKIPSNQQNRKPDLTTITKATELSFNLVHQALHKVIGAQGEDYCKGQIIYYLVCLFESTMGSLTQLCTASPQTVSSTVLQETSKGNRKKTQSQGNSQKKKASMISKEKRLKIEKKEAHLLLDLLCTMAMSLDLTRNEDQEVMEGFLFIVINRRGVLGNQVSDTEIMNSRFILNTKRRLQKTLMQAVFGDDDPLFRGGLVRPATPPALSDNGRSSTRQKFPEWFTEELWRLVGWDLLNFIPERG